MFHLAVVLEKGRIVDDSLVRRMRPNLSYNFSETGPSMVCLIRVPSMRILKRLPISPSNCGASFLPGNVAMLSGLTV